LKNIKLRIHRKNTVTVVLVIAFQALNLSFPQASETNSFNSVNRLVNPRFLHTATLLANGQVLVAGGHQNHFRAAGIGSEISSDTSSAELYDPVTDTWTATATWKATETYPMLGTIDTGREAHTATLLHNGNVLIAGGRNVRNYSLFGFANIYDPTSGTWRSAGSMNTSRAYHTATLLANGMVLVVGGEVSHLRRWPSAELYNPNTDTWTVTADMMTHRNYYAATLLSNGHVLITGGQEEFSQTNHAILLASTESYNPDTGKWTASANMNRPRQFHTATLLPNGKVLVVGGIGKDISISSSAELFDPAAEKWLLTGNLLTPHAHHTATLLPDGKVLVTGGRASSTAEMYDPAAGTWTTVGHLTTPRAYHTATLLPSGEVLFVGGTRGEFRRGDELSSYIHLREPNSLESAEVFGTRTESPTISRVLSTPTVTAINLTDPQMVTGGFQLAFNNLPNATFTVIATTNLLLPNSDWTVLGRATEVSPGLYRFVDLGATNDNQRFYRVRSP
jgi:N-acetylneuraminic acid mutarotase